MEKLLSLRAPELIILLLRTQFDLVDLLGGMSINLLDTIVGIPLVLLDLALLIRHLIVITVDGMRGIFTFVLDRGHENESVLMDHTAVRITDATMNDRPILVALLVESGEIDRFHLQTHL